jgi:hypothetical protein
LSELIPQAVEKLADAIEHKESWAIKLLLEAAGFERIACHILDEKPAEAREPVISTEFERELVERVLNVFRGRVPEQGASGNDQV